jgi:hypothetical protein
MIVLFTEQLLQQLQERIELYSQRICLGPIDSFEEYKGQAGKIQGLLEAMELVKILVQKLYESGNGKHQEEE